MDSGLTSIETISLAANGILGLAAMYLYTENSKQKSIGGEFNKIRQMCAKDEIPMAVLNDKGNYAIPFGCRPADKNDSLVTGPRKKKDIKTDYTLVAPNAAQTSAQMEISGLGKICIYQNPYHFPQDIRDNAALCAFANHINADRVLGKFRNPLKMLELCWNRNNTFRTECRKYISYAVQFNLENGHSIRIPFAPRAKDEQEND